jgi:prepilin-type N-terminal cleavage/methylation domain-containing protein
MMSWREEHGFTLVEMLVTTALAAIVFGATLTILDVFQSNNRRDQLRNETQDSARSAVDRIARQLRNVIAPSAGYNGALEQAGPYSITFQTVDTAQVAGGKNAANAMRVRYCLNDSNPTNEILWIQIKRGWTTAAAPELPSATACPDLAGGDWSSSTQLVQHVTNDVGGQNRPLFVYGPTGATEVPQIISVEPDIFIDLNPGQRPGETQLTSGVYLRNENRQPTAAFTTTQLGGNHQVQLNASASRDPDGLALTYRWWQDATELSTTAQQTQTEVLKEGSSHTFKLQVTDAGGLTNTTSQVVIVK